MRRLFLTAALTLFETVMLGCSSQLPDFERMRQQQRTDPYEGSRVFSDGLAMRVPPTGTVPYDPAPHSIAVTTGLDRGAHVHDIPVPVTADLVAAGKRQFEIFCAVCHGSDASGRSVMARNMPGIPPPSLLTAGAADHPAGYFFELISHGRNRMPAYDWALPPLDRWGVVAYLRTLQASAAQQITEAGR
jgi:mono/diheme cytochrome c family protein